VGMNDAQTSLEHRVIQKVDFGRMQVGARSSCNCMVWWITRPRIHCLFCAFGEQVLGQFNMGFIIARLGQDLYILDQHACDEKYRYEMLQKSTNINTQPLVVAKELDLEAPDEMVVEQNLTIFKDSGFDLHVDMSAPPGKRVKLLAVPFSKATGPSFPPDARACMHPLCTQVPVCNMSHVLLGVEGVRASASKRRIHNHAAVGDGRACAKALECASEQLTDWVAHSTVFGAADVHEMLCLLRENPGVPCRPSKVSAMFASRACRSAIMIGKSLTRQMMRQVVEHMGTMDQPWNCPHGRPTMRHLFDLSTLQADPAVYKGPQLV